MQDRCYRPGTCRRGRDKHWFAKFHLHQRFGHADNVRIIRAEAVNDGEAATLEVSLDRLEYRNIKTEFLNIVATGDELWVYGYNSETKVNSSQWEHSISPSPK